MGQRFTKTEEEIERLKEDVGQRFGLVEIGLQGLRQEVEQRFDELNARMFNSLSYRAHHQIHPVALLRDRHIEKPDENVSSS